MVAYKSGVVCGKETAQMCDKVEHQVRIPTHTHRVCSKKELAVIHATTLACIPLQDSSYDVYTLQRTTGYTIITYQCKLREETTARGHNTLHTLMAWEGGGGVQDNKYTCTHTHAHTHMHSHAHTHAYKHAHTHAHTHAPHTAHTPPLDHITSQSTYISTHAQQAHTSTCTFMQPQEHTHIHVHGTQTAYLQCAHINTPM